MRRSIFLADNKQRKKYIFVVSLQNQVTLNKTSRLYLVIIVRISAEYCLSQWYLAHREWGRVYSGGFFPSRFVFVFALRAQPRLIACCAGYLKLDDMY